MTKQFAVSWDVVAEGAHHIPRLLIRDGATWHAYAMPREPLLHVAMSAAKRYAAVASAGLAD